jgi:hypothetical protein
MAHRLTITLPPELLAELELHKPKYQSLSGFCCHLFEQALDRAGTLTERATATPPKGGGAIESGVSKAVLLEVNKTIKKQPIKATTKKAKDVFSARAISPDLIPADLLDCQQLLPEWWTVKKGVRSEGVWNRVCGKLRGWTPEDRRRALEASIANGWGDVFEPRPTTARQAKVAVDEGAARLERFREKGWI